MSNTKSAESTLSESIFNRQALVRLILPLLAEQFLSVSMGMADTLMVSGVGEAAVSSVSLVDSLNILIIQILSALATGGAVISSQYLGRRDGEKAAKSAAQLYTVLAVSTIAVMLVILAPALSLQGRQRLAEFGHHPSGNAAGRYGRRGQSRG